MPGILGVDAAFDGVAANLHVALVDAQLLPGGHFYLQLHDVSAGDHLRHRVLHLDAGVHLHEIKVTVAIHQELHGARTRVIDSMRSPDRRLAQGADEAFPHPRRRRLLQQLLMAALNRTIARAEVDDIVMPVGQDLHLDVARFGNVLLQVELPAAERGFGFRLGRLQGAANVLPGMHHAHPAPAAAGRRFHDDGEPHRVGNVHGVTLIAHRPLAARDHRHPGRLHALPGRRLVPHDGNRLRRGADERDIDILADFGEVRVLRQEAVAGVNGVHAEQFGGAHDIRDVQIRLCRRGRADAERLVRQADVQRVPVGVRVDRHRADAQFTARPDDPNGDLAPICDEEFAKHGLSVHRNYVYLVYLVYSVSLVLLPTPTKCW